jgi:Zn-dependent peptidase ImmA (M78 family)
MINSTSKSAIKDLAAAISSIYSQKIKPLEEIVKSEDILLIHDCYDLNTFDGMTVFDNSEFYIHLNTDRVGSANSNRSRFTLAHELGHYFIDNHRIGLMEGTIAPHPSFIDQVQNRSIEREADYFASCLLMPEVTFSKDIQAKKFNFDIIEFLSKEYNVSKTAAAFRFADIGNHPIMIVFSDRGVIQWSYSSSDFPHKYLVDNRNVPVNTVMGDFHYKQNKSDTYKTEEVSVKDWFRIYDKTFIENSCFEHCITYNKYALSIIWEE